MKSFKYHVFDFIICFEAYMIFVLLPLHQVYSLNVLLMPAKYLFQQAKLWCDCPFWPDDGMCRLRDCSVCECPENEFPEPFRKPSGNGLTSDNPVCQEGKPEAVVDRTIDAKAFKGWMEVDNPWTNDDEMDNGAH